MLVVITPPSPAAIVFTGCNEKTDTSEYSQFPIRFPLKVLDPKACAESSMILNPYFEERLANRFCSNGNPAKFTAITRSRWLPHNKYSSKESIDIFKESKSISKKLISAPKNDAQLAVETKLLVVVATLLSELIPKAWQEICKPAVQLDTATAYLAPK